VVTELASVKGLYGTATGEYLFLSGRETMEFEMSITETKSGDNRWGCKYDWK